MCKGLVRSEMTHMDSQRPDVLQLKVSTHTRELVRTTQMILTRLGCCDSTAYRSQGAIPRQSLSGTHIELLKTMPKTAPRPWSLLRCTATLCSDLQTTLHLPCATVLEASLPCEWLCWSGEIRQGMCLVRMQPWMSELFKSTLHRQYFMSYISHKHNHKS